jgi:hypothetical protein
MVTSEDKWKHVLWVPCCRCVGAVRVGHSEVHCALLTCLRKFLKPSKQAGLAAPSGGVAKAPKCYDKLWRHSDTVTIFRAMAYTFDPPTYLHMIEALPPSSSSSFTVGRGFTRHRATYIHTNHTDHSVATLKRGCVCRQRPSATPPPFGEVLCYSVETTRLTPASRPRRLHNVLPCRSPGTEP